MTEKHLNPAPSGTRRLCVMRDGHAVVREWKIPQPDPGDRTGRLLALEALYLLVAGKNGHDRTLIDTDGL